MPYARRERLDVARNVLAIELVHQALIGVVRQIRMAARFAVEKQIQLLWCIISYSFVVIEVARMRIYIAFLIDQSRERSSLPRSAILLYQSALRW